MPSFAACEIGGPGTGPRCVFSGLKRRDGFVFGFVFGFVRVFVLLARDLATKFWEAVEIFDSTAMEALGLGLKSKKRGGDDGLPGEAIEPEGEPVGVVLFETISMPVESSDRLRMNGSAGPAMARSN